MTLHGIFTIIVMNFLRCISQSKEIKQTRKIYLKKIDIVAMKS